MNKEKIQKVIDALKDAKQALEEEFVEPEILLNDALVIMHEELDKPLPTPIGHVLDDDSFLSVGFDKRAGRVIWIANLNEFRNGAKLYAEPPASSEKKPMNDDDIANIYRNVNFGESTIEDIVRAVELFHGIGK